MTFMDVGYHSFSANNECSPLCNIEAVCEVIIEFRDVTAPLVELIGKYGVIKCRLPMINSFVVELPVKYVAELEAHESVAAVFENTRITAQMNNGRRSVLADAAHAVGYDGAGVTIAFLDTGIASLKDFTYPKNRIRAFNDLFRGIGTPYDDNGHGTHVWGRFS